jgi:hypothetical protein
LEYPVADDERPPGVPGDPCSRYPRDRRPAGRWPRNEDDLAEILGRTGPSWIGRCVGWQTLACLPRQAPLRFDAARVIPPDECSRLAACLGSADRPTLFLNEPGTPPAQRQDGQAGLPRTVRDNCLGILGGSPRRGRRLQWSGANSQRFREALRRGRVPADRHQPPWLTARHHRKWRPSLIRSGTRLFSGRSRDCNSAKR